MYPKEFVVSLVCVCVCVYLAVYCMQNDMHAMKIINVEIALLLQYIYICAELLLWVSIVC